MSGHKYLVLNRTIGAALMLAGALVAGAAQADTASYSQWQGWVNSNGNGPELDKLSNMYTGAQDGALFNSYAAFTIPAGSYGSVTLKLNPMSFGDMGPVQIGLYDVSTPIDGFLNTVKFGAGVYNDLGSGHQYATATLGDDAVSVTFNAAGLADVNAAAGSGKLFFIGFTNLTLDANGLGTDAFAGVYINGLDRSRPPMEMDLGPALPVPEPSAWATLLAGLTLIGAMALRRRQA
ncbi:PEP-CTERM sorting domain-containing protein [Rugamonas sp.]|uniref:PEP-CTERM sorting domain-containing protein n=1 Tax=Rugamonas sp. TaxID=1926287 RepID=UPI0025D4E3B9|nr:PEP-CTERM sorting domain-containing protein [Rugamonas sp.]